MKLSRTDKEVLLTVYHVISKAICHSFLICSGPICQIWVVSSCLYTRFSIEANTRAIAFSFSLLCATIANKLAQKTKVFKVSCPFPGANTAARTSSAALQEIFRDEDTTKWKIPWYRRAPSSLLAWSRSASYFLWGARERTEIRILFLCFVRIHYRL